MFGGGTNCSGGEIISNKSFVSNFWVKYADSKLQIVKNSKDKSWKKKKKIWKLFWFDGKITRNISNFDLMKNNEKCLQQ